MPGGQPPYFASPQDLIEKITDYFEFIKGEMKDDKWIREPEPITITGLCIHLGFESRQSFYDYEKREEYSYIIKAARLRVENGYEKRLNNQNVTGAIFALKNMGWYDKQLTELTGENGGTIKTEMTHNIKYIDPGA